MPGPYNPVPETEVDLPLIQLIENSDKARYVLVGSPRPPFTQVRAVHDVTTSQALAVTRARQASVLGWFPGSFRLYLVTSNGWFYCYKNGVIPGA